MNKIYVTPSVEVIEVELEGILCASGDPYFESNSLEDFIYGGSLGDTF